MRMKWTSGSRTSLEKKAITVPGGLSAFGEYQMGDVNARSCVVIGTSSAIFT